MGRLLLFLAALVGGMALVLVPVTAEAGINSSPDGAVVQADAASIPFAPTAMEVVADDAFLANAFCICTEDDAAEAVNSESEVTIHRASIVASGLVQQLTVDLAPTMPPNSTAEDHTTYAEHPTTMATYEREVSLRMIWPTYNTLSAIAQLRRSEHRVNVLVVQSETTATMMSARLRTDSTRLTDRLLWLNDANAIYCGSIDGACDGSCDYGGPEVYGVSSAITAEDSGDMAGPLILPTYSLSVDDVSTDGPPLESEVTRLILPKFSAATMSDVLV